MRCEKCKYEALYKVRLGTDLTVYVCQKHLNYFISIRNQMKIPIGIEIFSYRKNWFWHGAKGIFKAIFGLDRTIIESDIKDRRRKCSLCVYRKRFRCKVCGCFIWAKTTLSTEKCPMGYW